MPLISAHVFAVHKGGCGKSTLAFHTSSGYAAKHPDQKVFVLDMTTLGDLSQLFLGGMKDGAGENKQEQIIAAGGKGTTALLTAASEAGGGTAGPSTPNDSGLSSLFKGLRVGGSSSAAAARPTINVEDYAVRVSDYNPQVPSNVYLFIGSPSQELQRGFSDEQEDRVVATLSSSVRSGPDRIKVFFDTDGDLKFSKYTRVAVRLSEGVVVPLEAGTLDFRRVETFLEELSSLHQQYNQRAAKMQVIVWNKIDVQTYKESSVSRYLTPTKAVIDKIDRLNKLLAEVASHYPSVFLHPVPEGRDTSSFISASSMCMQLFGNTGDCALEYGIPFATLTPGRHGDLYNIAEDKLAKCRNNVNELVDKF